MVGLGKIQELLRGGAGHEVGVARVAGEVLELLSEVILDYKGDIDHMEDVFGHQRSVPAE